LVCTTHGEVTEMIDDVAAMSQEDARHMYRSAYRCIRDAIERFDKLWAGQQQRDPEATKAWRDLCNDVVIVCALRLVLHGILIRMVPSSSVSGRGTYDVATSNPVLPF
jgi:hypothetical protein